MNTIKKLITIFMASALCFCFSGCGESVSEKMREAQQYAEEKQRESEQYAAQKQREAEFQKAEIVEQKIKNIFANTQACDGWAPSIAEMINTVFHKYEWDYEQQSDNENQYIVTFTGTYSPNPDIPNLAQKGEIVYLVDFQSNQAVLYSDPNRISVTFMVYIVN